MSDIIKPSTLKGFRDFLPEIMISREQLMETAREVYRSYGFVPIDTPTLEKSEILCGKGSDETDRQMYRFMHGDRDVAMRFDLTVPLARFVAQHENAIGMPFKRYHIGSVWRGERPQAGRFREFAQCDFDTIGSTSIASDIEMLLVINDLLRAIGFEKFQIRLNNRKVLNGLLQKSGLENESVVVLRALDKLAKNGREKVKTEMLSTTSADESQVDSILRLAEVEGNTATILEQLGPLCEGNELAEEGRAQLQQTVKAVNAVGLTDENLKIDVSIARGLDYYTGTIVETFLEDLPKFGSVCSGGRYDNLAQLYTKTELPGIGASLGLDRLLAGMEMLKMIPESQTTADLLIIQFDADQLTRYLQIAADLRRQGLKVEVFPTSKKLKAQFKYANRKGFPAVLIVGEDELQRDVVKIKWMEAGTESEVSLAPGAQAIGDHLKNEIG